MKTKGNFDSNLGGTDAVDTDLACPRVDMHTLEANRAVSEQWGCVYTAWRKGGLPASFKVWELQERRGPRG